MKEHLERLYSKTHIKYKDGRDFLFENNFYIYRDEFHYKVNLEALLLNFISLRNFSDFEKFRPEEKSHGTKRSFLILNESSVEDFLKYNDDKWLPAFGHDLDFYYNSSKHWRDSSLINEINILVNFGTRVIKFGSHGIIKGKYQKRDGYIYNASFKIEIDELDTSEEQREILWDIHRLLRDFKNAQIPDQNKLDEIELLNKNFQDFSLDYFHGAIYFKHFSEKKLSHIKKDFNNNKGFLIHNRNKLSQLINETYNLDFAREFETYYFLQKWGRYIQKFCPNFFYERSVGFNSNDRNFIQAEFSFLLDEIVLNTPKNIELSLCSYGIYKGTLQWRLQIRYIYYNEFSRYDGDEPWHWYEVCFMHLESPVNKLEFIKGKKSLWRRIFG